MKSLPPSSRRKQRGTAFLFPGSGAQHLGMGRGLRDSFPSVEKELRRVDRAAGRAVSSAMDGPREILFPSLGSRDYSLSMEVNVALALAVSRALLYDGARPPDAAAGRSMGEYSAACFSGALSARTCMRLVRRVSELGHRDCLADPGSLVTVYGLGRTELEAIAAGIRADGYLCEVVSFYDKPSLGFAAVRASGLPRLKKALRPFRHRITVSRELGAYHSSLFDHLAADAAALFAKACFSPPARRLYMNLDGEAERSPSGLRRKLAAALNSPVMWQDTIANMLRDGIRTFVEMAPGAMLTEFICDLPPDAEVLRTDTPENYRRALRRLSGR